MTKAERQEAIRKARKIKEEKQFKAFYEENKMQINRDHYIGYEAFKRNVEKNIKSNPRFDLKDPDNPNKQMGLVAAAKKTLRTKHFMEQDKLGAMNIVDIMKMQKTGNQKLWRRVKTYAPSGDVIYTNKMREETTFDIFRSKLGILERGEDIMSRIYYDKSTKSYHFTGQGGVDYEIIYDESKQTITFLEGE